MKKPAVAALIAAVMVVPLMLVAQPALAQEDDYTYDDTWDDWEDSTWDDWDDESWDDENWDYVYDEVYELDELDEGAMAAFTGIMVAYFGVIACIGLVSYIYTSLALSTIGKKLGEDQNWMAWVPIANFLYMSKLAGFSPWLGLLMFIPLVNLGFGIYALMKISERRGFQSWIGILVLVPLVGIAVPGYLAWAKSGNEDGGSPAPAPDPAQPQPGLPETPAKEE